MTAPIYPHLPQEQAANARTRLRRLLTGVAAGFLPAASQPAGPPQRLLLLRPDHLGDLLFLAPALHWLRRELPRAHIILAVGPWARPALPALQGSFDELLEVRFPAFERGERTGWAERWARIIRLGRAWRGLHADTALILRPDHWWGAMVCAVAGIPRRWGYATPETAPWLTRALPLPHEHAAASNLRLVQRLLGASPDPDPRHHPLRFAVSSAWQQEADALLRQHGYRLGRPLVIIHPGSGAAVKLWPEAKWGQVSRRLADTGATVFISGGPGEEALTARVRAQAGPQIIDLGGKTPFGVLAALMQRASLVLGVDSGPLHLAVALGTPTVHLYGPADAVRFGPWGDAARHVVLRSHWRCIPCQKLDWTDLEAHGCVRDIPVPEVVTVARRLLGETHEAAHST